MTGDADTNLQKKFIQKLADENRKYYGSTRGRGILKAIKLSFDHSWIYIFELVQNALDAGAKTISIQIGINGNSLIFQHDGNQRLGKEDVERISQILLSDKGVSSVGFMGIGFKSIFARFRDVRISGWNWYFRFNVQYDRGDRYGDEQPDLLGAVVPIWDARIQNPSHNFTTRFELSNRIVPSEELSKDLGRFLFDDDGSLLAILANCGLRRLEVNERVWNLNVVSGSCSTSIAMAATRSRSMSWQLFEVEFQPSNEAVKCFLEQRGSSGFKEEEAAAQPRRVLGILPLDEDGFPASTERGRVFATLPTDVSLPFGIHINADWLLNISRTGLKEIEENAWQREIVDCIANVLARFLVWSADTYSDPAAARASFNLLAAPDPTAGGLESLFAEDRWLTTFAELLKNSAVLPVWTDKNTRLAYAAPEDSTLPPCPLADAFDEMPDLRPGVLLERKIIKGNILGNNAKDLLSQANLLNELTPLDLEQAWPKGIRQWWEAHSETEEKRQHMLLRIWAAVAELSEKEKWQNIELKCVPTVAGNWLSVEQVSRLEEELPSKNEPSGEETRDFIKPYIEVMQRVPKRLIRALQELERNNRYTSITYTKARNWFESHAQSISLASIVQEALCQLASSEDPDWSVLVPLGRWAKNRNRSDLLTYVLVDSRDGSTGVRVSRAVVAAPYVQNGVGRIRIYPENSPISKKYLDSSDDSNEIESWKNFFYQAEVKGKLKIKCLEDHSKRFERDRVAEFVGSIENDISESNGRGYKLFDYDIVPDLQSADSSLEFRSAIAPWLDEGRSELKGKGHRLTKYFYFVPEERRGTNVCTWVKKLMDIEWVPCNDDELRMPECALARKDPERPHSPFAVLSGELTRVLEKEGLKFGSAVPDTIAVHKLKAKGKMANVEELIQMLRDCRSQIKSKTDKIEFAAVLESITFPLTGGRRIPLSRVVKSRNRNLLDGWITEFREFDQSLQVELLEANFPFPDSTTGRQALEFIRNVWKKAKATPDKLHVEEINALPFAYEYCLEDCSEDDKLLALWRDALPEAVLATGAEWIVRAEIDELFVDDLADRRYIPEEICPRAIPEEHLGITRRIQLQATDEFNLRSLKESVELSWTEGESMDVPAMWLLRIGLVCNLLMCSGSAGGRVEFNSIEVANGNELKLVLVRELKLAVNILDSEPENVPVDARLNGNILVIAGRPNMFASDAAKELMQLFSVNQYGTFGADLTNLLLAIGNSADFRRAVNKFCRSHARYFEISSAYEKCFTDDVGPVQGRERSVTNHLNASGKGRDQSFDGRDDPAGQCEGLDNDFPVGSRGASAVSGSFTQERAEAPQRALDKLLRQQLKGEIVPSSDVKHNDSRTSGMPSKYLGDERYRAAAARYEKERGWDPELAGPHQVGWDIRSSDPNTGAVRLIEVKGKGTPWTSGEVVELSRAQVRTAFQTALENAVGWYLYVVECGDDGSCQVLPIKNPVDIAGSWMLRGEPWRLLAENTKQIDFL